MNPEFTLFSEVQKQLTFHHHKTWRLLNKLRKQERMKEGEDWIKRDDKLYVNMPRFYVELEHLGFRNFVRDEFLQNQTTSSDVILQSDDSEQNQTEITLDENTPQKEEEMKPTEIKSEDLQSDDSEQNRVTSSVNDDAKDKLIKFLESAIDRAEEEAKTLRASLTSALKQNADLTRMTHLLVAPKAAEQGSSRPAPKTASTEPTVVQSEDVDTIANHPTEDMV